MNNKKGLSDVVATVLIILLALAAVVIVWSFVSPSLRNTGSQIDVQSKCLATEVKPTACNSTAGTSTIQLVRGDPDQVKVIFTNLATSAKTPGDAVDAPSTVLGTTSDSDATTLTSGETYTASAAAIYLVDSNEYTCPESQTVIPCSK